MSAMFKKMMCSKESKSDLLFLKGIDKDAYDFKKNKIFAQLDTFDLDCKDEFVAEVILDTFALISREKIKVKNALNISDPKKMGEYPTELSLEELKEKSAEQIKYELKQCVDGIADIGYLGLQFGIVVLFERALFMIDRYKNK